jgi:hypothetical protein
MAESSAARHGVPAAHAAKSAPSSPIQRLPLRGLFRIGHAPDIWYKAAVSAVVTIGTVLVTLLALGRLDLAVYCLAGAFCALYGHGLPYPARARTILGLAVGMIAGAGVAMATSALTHSIAVRVAVASVLAAVQKVACDASHIGPPGNIVPTFLTAALSFAPQQLADIPSHLGLACLGAALGWLVCMAPAVVRPHGPERIASARALEAAARLALAGQDPPARTRHEATAMLDAAWRTLARMSNRRSSAARIRHQLEDALLQAEAMPTDGPAPRRLTSWARKLRQNRPLPDELPSAATGSGQPHPTPHIRPAWRALLGALKPGSPLLPVGLRTLVGCAVGGWLSMAIGVGRPYWAVVTAASLFQANAALSWHRAVNRVLGTFLGVLLFTALIPVVEMGHPAMVAAALVCLLGMEATIARSYWLGTTFITPLALIVAQLAKVQPARELAIDRWEDTCIGAVIGVLCCLLITNRRATHRVHSAIAKVAEATTEALRLLETDTTRRACAPPGHRTATHHELGRARHRLVGALMDLRQAADAAGGEWWQPHLARRHVADAEYEGHLTLAALARHRIRLSRPTPTEPVVATTDAGSTADLPVMVTGHLTQTASPTEERQVSAAADLPSSGLQPPH